MPMPSLEQTTQLALNLGRGDRVAAEELIPVVYDELRGLAARYIKRERSDHTLQPTALVNEVYLRLVDSDKLDWHGRAQFFALAARQIRRILVEHARHRGWPDRAADEPRTDRHPDDVRPAERRALGHRIESRLSPHFGVLALRDHSPPFRRAVGNAHGSSDRPHALGVDIPSVA